MAKKLGVGPQGDREGTVGCVGGRRTLRLRSITNRKGEPEPDPDLRDNENVPLPEVPVAVGGRPDGPAREPRVPKRRRRLHGR